MNDSEQAEVLRRRASDRNLRETQDWQEVIS